MATTPRRQRWTLSKELGKSEETDLAGRIANRPVPKHEEEVVVKSLVKTSLLVPKNNTWTVR